MLRECPIIEVNMPQSAVVYIRRRLKNLRIWQKKRCKTESEVLRGMLEIYLKRIENKDLSYKHFKRICPTGLKFIARTITKEQDKRLRLLASKTGKSISEMMREVVEGFIGF